MVYQDNNKIYKQKTQEPYINNNRRLLTEER